MSDINLKPFGMARSRRSTPVQYLIFWIALPLLVVLTHGAEASRSAMDQGARDRCSANLRPFGQYDRLISDAAQLHINSGVLTQEDFSGVLMGWCDLVDKSPGVETLGQAHCRPPMSVFFDSRLQSRQFFSSRGYIIHTFAHEMEHIRQYRSEGCEAPSSLSSQQEELAEIAADRAVGVLTFGRYIFVENLCHKSIRFILMFRPHWTLPYKVDGWWALPAGSIIGLTDRDGNGLTTSDKNIYFYAESEDGRKWTGQDRVRFQGQDYGVMKANVYIYGDRRHSGGSFNFGLSCP